MIRVGIIGCGKIADLHVEQILRIPDCEIVGTCDSELLMAKQLAERFGVKHCFDDANLFLEQTKPQIVHITTPPQSHSSLGKLCLEAGCHLYIEKPFAVNIAETEELIKLATAKNLKLTVGHDYQFMPATRRMRELIKSGYLGGTPVHMESYYCYDLGEASYAKALLGDSKHWVRTLPGKLLHNVISHGISKIAEYIDSENPKVIAHGFTSDFLKNVGADDLTDEVRVIIDGNNGRTAYFTFSSQMRPTLHLFRIFGQKNGIIVDSNHQTMVKVNGTRYKSYLDKFVPPIVFAKYYFMNFLTNVNLFRKREFHMSAGMKSLIESFYRSVTLDSPLPIPYKEILLTSKIMEEIFSQLNCAAKS